MNCSHQNMMLILFLSFVCTNVSKRANLSSPVEKQHSNASGLCIQMYTFSCSELLTLITIVCCNFHVCQRHILNVSTVFFSQNNLLYETLFVIKSNIFSVSLCNSNRLCIRKMTVDSNRSLFHDNDTIQTHQRKSAKPKHIPIKC